MPTTSPPIELDDVRRAANHVLVAAELLAQLLPMIRAYEDSDERDSATDIDDAAEASASLVAFDEASGYQETMDRLCLATAILADACNTSARLNDQYIKRLRAEREASR